MKTFGDFSTKKDWYTLMLSLLVVTLHFPNGYFARNDTAIARGITAFIFKWTVAVVLFAVMVFFVMSGYMMFRNARRISFPES
ncbi:MAG: hypothetical protein RSD52_00025 [Oscillospiraceae bacterium]